MNDKVMAQKLIDGLEWLSAGGRESAQILDREMTDKGCLEEALSWLTDLEEGKQP